MSEREVLNLSEVRDRTGVPIETLRLLISDGLLPGVVRGSRGHVKVYADQVPTWHGLRVLLERERAAQLQQAGEWLRRVEREVEAVRNDIAAAVEHPEDDLGVDLVNVKSFQRTDGDGSSLASALLRLERKTWSVRAYDEALKGVSRLSPQQWS